MFSPTCPAKEIVLEELCMSLIDGFCQCSTILFGEVSNFLTGYKLKCNYPVGVCFL